MYSILTPDESIFTLCDLALKKRCHNVKEVFLKTSDSVNWLMENPANRLIVITPFQQNEREAMQQEIGIYRDRCIGLEPKELIGNQNIIFKNSQPIEIALLPQIKEIIGYSKKI